MGRNQGVVGAVLPDDVAVAVVAVFVPEHGRGHDDVLGLHVDLVPVDRCPAAVALVHEAHRRSRVAMAVHVLVRKEELESRVQMADRGLRLGVPGIEHREHP
ncbi:hypothetical protein GCM10007147_43610 [Nocardiopsis kunsanensis]|uniref:Uncharacterized protein n=1 Tax=Nocardiopsis kunsanensis TaxID=141693 RepID=A0A918XKI2_9ACTN|nr:hypothetical protein GCM10007147_43610 [Nocardiopsis kunsanensis]